MLDENGNHVVEIPFTLYLFLSSGIEKWHPRQDMYTDFSKNKQNLHIDFIMKAGKAKSLWVDDEPRYIYHDVHANRWFLTYKEFLEPYYDDGLCERPFHEVRNPFCSPI